jgi:predicted phosphodiesterase
MPDVSRRDFLRYAVYCSALAGGGLFSSGVSIGKELPTTASASGKANLFAVCISDLHIGERYGGVTGAPGKPTEYFRMSCSDEKKPYVRLEFIEFLKNCKIMKQKYGKIEYLIILGDMWDLAMNNQEDSFGLSTVLFRNLNNLDKNIMLGELFEKIIYVPGNHDHHFWTMIQEKYWVTERLEKGLVPLEMPRIVSLTVDINTGNVLHDITLPEDQEIPFHNLASSLLGLNISTPLYIAYPHIFLKKQKGEYILLTHGHLFEPNWNMITMMFGGQMTENNIPMTIRNIEMFNAITTELHSYSLGQTPPYEFWEKIYDLHFNNQAPSKWEKGIMEILKAHFYLRPGVKLDQDPKTQSTKFHDIEALQAERKLVEHYLTQAKKEYLDREDEITSLIYGHTHIPSFGEIFVRYDEEKKRPLNIYNTGGWVNIDPATFHMPVPMLIYEDGTVGALRLT